jgi:type 1 glutamine amidotransferase
VARGLILFLLLVGCTTPKTVLIISKTAGYRHASIEFGVQAISTIAHDLDFKVLATEDCSILCTETYDVVVFLNTTGTILNKEERDCLRSFVEEGGGFLGIHSAADTEYDWPWYGETLLGAWFVSHPPVSESTITIHDRSHPSTVHLQADWICTDEWYVYDRVPEKSRVLLSVHGHPLAWCKEIKKGKSFYTGRGHTNACFTESDFIEHIKGGLKWVVQ